MLQTIEVPVVLIRLVELGQSVSSLSDQNTASIFKIMIIFVSAKSLICRWSLLYFHFISSLLISLVSLRYLIWPLLNLHRYTRLGTFAWALNVSKGASHHLSSKYKRVEISRFQKAFLKFEQKQTSIIYFLILFELKLSRDQEKLVSHHFIKKIIWKIYWILLIIFLFGRKIEKYPIWSTLFNEQNVQESQLQNLTFHGCL